MFWAQLVPIALFFFGLFFIPESPRYLVAAGKTALGRRPFLTPEDHSHPKDAPAKVAEIQATLAKADHRPSLKDLFNSTTGKVHPIVWVGLVIAALQQFVGINVIFYYGATLWHAAGYTEADALKINVMGGTINVLSTLVAIVLVDKWGRKPLLITGSIGMTITLGYCGIHFWYARTWLRTEACS